MKPEWWRAFAELLKVSFDEDWNNHIQSLTQGEVQAALLLPKGKEKDVREWLQKASALREELLKEASALRLREESTAVGKVEPGERERDMIARLGLWFWFYFRATPCPLLWEDVAQLRDKVGGYPRGGFLHKLAGDIYRVERFRLKTLQFSKTAIDGVVAVEPHARIKGQQSGGQESKVDRGILVVAYTPMAVLPNETKMPELNAGDSEMDAVEKRIERLARQYAFLQMMLYLSKNYPMTYGFSLLAAKGEINKRGTLLGDSARHTERLFQPIAPNQRLVAFTDDALLRNMPTSVLGTDRGVVSEGAIVSQDESHAPAPCRLVTGIALEHRRKQFQKALAAAESQNRLFEVLVKADAGMKVEDWTNA